MIGATIVIGLGRFGGGIVRSLTRMGVPVLAVDADQALVDALAGDTDAVVRADATDERALMELHLERMTCAVVAIGEKNVEASILSTALLRKLGVPRIVARASTPLHARVLQAVGAHEVVNPEAEMGERLARRLAQPSVVDRIEMEDGTVLAEIAVPASFVDRSLVELDVRRRFGVLVVAVRRDGELRSQLAGSDRFAEGDVMVVIGRPESVDRLGARVG